MFKSGGSSKAVKQLTVEKATITSYLPTARRPPAQQWRRPMQEALIVHRETHIPAPPATVFALLTDPDKILSWWKRWPTANIGIATGAGAGFIVIDIDVIHQGDDTLRHLVEQRAIDRIVNAPRLEQCFNHEAPLCAEDPMMPAEWSPAREIGHLVDLEPLWLRRVHEILDGVVVTVRATVCRCLDGRCGSPA